MEKTDMKLTPRMKRVAEHIEQGSWLYIDDVIDIFYLTGLTVSLGAILLSNKKAELFLDGRYTNYVNGNCRDNTTKEIGKVAGGKTVYFNSNQLSYAKYQQLKKTCALKPLKGTSPVALVRMVKEKKELALIKKSCELLEKSYRYIRKRVKVGVSEQELAQLFEDYARKHGASGVSFEPIIAFGTNAAMPHHRSGREKLKKNTGILMDLGLMVDGYASDMTRCFFYGTVSEKLKGLYKSVERAHAAALARVQPGATVADLDNAARDVFDEEGLLDLYTHSLGHGVGLEVHEGPGVSYKRKDVLEEGMVITIEPGLYDPKVGGIRLEDMYVITKKGARRLTGD